MPERDRRRETRAFLQRIGDVIPAQAGAVVGVEDGQTRRHGGGSPRKKRDWGSELLLGTRWRRPIGGGARVGGTTGRTTTIDGGNPPVSLFMVIVMVDPRKLTEGINRHFPPPSWDLGAKRILQTKGIQETKPVLRRFWGYQIVPNFTNFDQKHAANGH